MNVILLERVKNLGSVGDEVVVKNGFGRNFLIPTGKATSATKSNRAEFEARRAELEAKAEADMATAKTRADKLEGLTITIAANAGTEGKLFGSIGGREIAQAVGAAGVDIEKHEVRLPEGAIRTTGEFEIDLHLHSDVNVAITLSITAED